jgi:hypothetical protein
VALGGWPVAGRAEKRSAFRRHYRVWAMFIRPGESRASAKKFRSLKRQPDDEAHQLATIDGGIRCAVPPYACYTNNAESFFSRMRRAEIGHRHYLAGPYLIRFAQEASWREDHRKEPNGGQVDRFVALAMANRPSVDFCGYWQRAIAS